MLDDSFFCLRSLIFWCKKIRMEFPKEPWMPEKLIRFLGLMVGAMALVVWWLGPHVNSLLEGIF